MRGVLNSFLRDVHRFDLGWRANPGVVLFTVEVALVVVPSSVVVVYSVLLVVVVAFVAYFFVGLRLCK